MHLPHVRIALLGFLVLLSGADKPLDHPRIKVAIEKYNSATAHIDFNAERSRAAEREKLILSPSG